MPAISVITDGGWSKRSHRHSYNTKSRVAVIICVHKKLLFLGVQNTYCSTCSIAKTTTFNIFCSYLQASSIDWDNCHSTSLIINIYVDVNLCFDTEATPTDPITCCNREAPPPVPICPSTPPTFTVQNVLFVNLALDGMVNVDKLSKMLGLQMQIKFE